MLRVYPVVVFISSWTDCHCSFSNASHDGELTALLGVSHSFGRRVPAYLKTFFSPETCFSDILSHICLFIPDCPFSPFRSTPCKFDPSSRSSQSDIESQLTSVSSLHMLSSLIISQVMMLLTCLAVTV